LTYRSSVRKGEVVVNGAYARRPLAHNGCHPLRRPGSYVADGKKARVTPLEREWATFRTA
jgi:hypothetical protein